MTEKKTTEAAEWASMNFTLEDWDVIADAVLEEWRRRRNWAISGPKELDGLSAHMARLDSIRERITGMLDSIDEAKSNGARQ